jgi:hypothetical protein
MIRGKQLPALPKDDRAAIIVGGGVSDSGAPVVFLSLGRPTIEETADGEMAASVMMTKAQAMKTAGDILKMLALAKEYIRKGKK